MKDESEEPETSIEDDNEDHPSVDKGWAWIVMIGALTINIIYDGCSYSFGIFFTHLLTYFGDSKSNTAWIGSLFFSIPLLCGPIASLLSSKYGYRKTSMLGGFIASLGFCVGAFSNSILFLCITYGIIAGFGMSLPYFNSIVVEAVYFRKRRALATGIAESGAGIGTVIFAPLTNYLIAIYGWRGAMLIIGGLVANIIVCGALFRPLIHRDKTVAVEAKCDKSDTKHTARNENDTLDDHYFMELVPTDKEMLHKDEPLRDRHSDLNASPSRGPDVMNEHYKSGACSEMDGSDLQTDFLFPKHSSKENNTLDQTDKPSIFHSMVELHENVSVSSNTSKVKDQAKGNVCAYFVFKYVANVFILTNRGFILFSISNFIMYFWYDVPYVFIVDKAITMNITDTSATFLVSIIGIVHTIGNIVYGILGDRQKISKSILYGISIINCGISIGLIPLFSSYEALAILSGLFGLFSAANEAMCSIILIDVVGLKNLNQAYGVIMMLQGIANLIGPPFAGKQFTHW